MSLINRMLQDLDARAGQPGAAPLPADVLPVAPPGRSLPWKRVALAAGACVAVAGAGVAGWRLLGPGQVSTPVAAVVPAARPAPAVPASIPAPVPVVAFEVPVPPRQDDAGPEVLAAAVQAPVAVKEEPVPPKLGREPAEPQAAAAAAAAPAAPQVAPKPVRAAAPTAAQGVAPKPAAPKAALPARGGRVETPGQRAENAYRRALAGLEDGRVTEAIAHLQSALKIDPRHEAARQTLVSLLMEAKRPDEAIRELGAALALDPRQPAMAMLMARLQIERGSPGIDTLLRTLPYAAGNGEYHAFLAGMLAREGRHREAVEHYGVALRTAPQNGVWWMGLGIALQAEKRNPEAAGAFQKALDSGTLSPELQGFVERKLKQLVR